MRNLHSESSNARAVPQRDSDAVLCDLFDQGSGSLVRHPNRHGPAIDLVRRERSRDIRLRKPCELQCQRQQLHELGHAVLLQFGANLLVHGDALVANVRRELATTCSLPRGSRAVSYHQRKNPCEPGVCVCRQRHSTLLVFLSLLRAEKRFHLTSQPETTPFFVKQSIGSGPEMNSSVTLDRRKFYKRLHLYII